MSLRKHCLPATVLAAAFLSVQSAWGLGFELGQTKEELKLEYEVSVADHGTGRVTINLSIADEGRLKPLDRGVQLVVPGKDGMGYVDLSVNLEREKVDGKQHVRVHLLRELAERAEIHLATNTLDGKQEPRTWYYHNIRIAEYLRNGVQKGK